MSFVVNNDYQTNLLFKQFVGVAAARLEDQFSVEKFRSIPNIFSGDVMIEEIPSLAPIKISGPNGLDASSNWTDSSANYVTNTIEESTYIDGQTFSQIYPDSNLKFYKRLSLVPCEQNSEGRVWGSFTDYSGTTMYANKESVLKHTIPFKFDDVGATYLPVVRYNKIQTGKGAGSSPYVSNFQIGNINANPLYWVMDVGTGFLQCYNTQTNLEGAGVKDIKISQIQDPNWAPVISCFVYAGKLGITNLDVSGQQQVGDLSNSSIDLNNIKRMILLDGSSNVLDLNDDDAIRTQYEYVRKNLFIGFPTQPIIDNSNVDHTQDPSLNNVVYELDVSGSTLLRRNLNVLGHTQLIDVSATNLDLSGNLNVLGHTQLADVSATNLDLSGNLNVSGHTQLVDVSATIWIYQEI